jgi:RNA polymerase sigma-54 factor
VAKMSQSMKMSQSLRMTPQLQQAIKMLQLSRLEMETAIHAELEENPILEETSEVKTEDLERAKEADAEVSPSTNDQDPQKQDEFDWDSYLENSQKPPQSQSGGNEEIMNYENIMTSQQNLHDHLNWQAKMYGFNEEELAYAELLINYIDDDGYLLTPLQEIADSEKIDVKELEDVIKFVQEFDPAGVGARDVKECLLIQARVLEEDTTDMLFLINNHLKDLEKRNYEAIAKAMSRDVREIVDIAKIIFSMDPKPGRSFAPQDTQYVMPDVYVYKVGDDYVVSLNDDGLPRLKISNFYKNMLQTAGGNKTTQSYIQEKLKSAVWLIKSIHQRQRTIYKVTEAIVRHQKDFLDRGSGFIRPMVLRDIANDIGMHESTVSRVTTSKYVHTPQGIYELKYFFNSGIDTTDGESMASESVKLKIKDLIAKESAKSPLSDQELVDLLKVDGIIIARRTVAKYRDVLRILPSSRRKKY